MSLADQQDYARVLYYGEPGTGKTTAAAHLAQLGHMAFFMAEPGLKKISIERQGVNTANIIPTSEVDCQYLIRSFWQLKQKLEAEPGSYVGVAIDTVSELVKRELASIRRREYDLAVAKANSIGQEYDGPRKVRTNWDHYGEMTDDMREVIKNYCDLPMHMAFTAHVRRDEDPDSGETRYGPAATPAVQNDLMAYVDCIIRTERQGNWFIGHTCPSEDGRYKGKDRLDVLPTPIMAMPTMDRIVAYVNGKLTENDDSVQHNWLNRKDNS